MTDLPQSRLRLCRTEALSRYLFDSYIHHRLGNVAFASYMQAGGCVPGDRWPFGQPWVLYHSWRDGFIELDDDRVLAAASLITDGPTTRGARALGAELSRLGWLEPAAVDLDAITQRTRTTFIAMQNLLELRRLLATVEHHTPKVVLEIGTARGGLLYALAQLAHPNALLISVDLPGGPNGGGHSESDREVFASFAMRTQSLCCILGNSHSEEVLGIVQETLHGLAVDLLVIDGDHSYEGTKSDLLRYGVLVAPNGLIALHDICIKSQHWGLNGAVGDLWIELQRQFDDDDPPVAIVDPTGASTPRRPADRPWAWGFGLLSGAQFARIDL